MIKPDQVSWEKLENPPSLFKVFKPTGKKLDFLYDKLLNEPLYVSDEGRVPLKIQRWINHYFPQTPEQLDVIPNISIFYEIGDFDGLVGFRDIIPEYKCYATLKFWNGKQIFQGMKGRDFIRQSKQLVKLFIDEFRLKRIESITADKNILRLTEMMGFKKEGEHTYGLMWNEIPYNSYSIAVIKEEV